MNEKQSVIIVAGGKGLRMGGDIPKQFVPLCDLPVLMHTISCFHTYSSDIDIILVLPISHQAYWNKLIRDYKFTIPHLVVEGGETRFHSVKNGLRFVEKGFVAIQDGVRPFVSQRLIHKCYQEAIKFKAVIPGIPSKDSLREISEAGNKIVDRSKIVLIQTPQIFDAELLKQAYDTPFQEFFTDDASVVEYAGKKITIVEGEDTNIKITTPIDLKVAELIVKEKLFV